MVRVDYYAFSPAVQFGVDANEPTQTHGHSKAIVERQSPAKARKCPTTAMLWKDATGQIFQFWKKDSWKQEERQLRKMADEISHIFRRTMRACRIPLRERNEGRRKGA